MKKVLRIGIPWVSTMWRQMLKSIQFNAKICPVSSRNMYGLVLTIKRLDMDKGTFNNNNNDDDEDDDGEDNADVRVP